MSIDGDAVTAAQIKQHLKAKGMNASSRILLVGKPGTRPKKLMALREEIIKQGCPTVHLKMPPRATATTEDDGSFIDTP